MPDAPAPAPDDVVARQYEAWAYPPPVDDMVEAIAGGYWEYADIPACGPVFWPDRRDVGDLDILVAGCGTNQAAYVALRNPTSRVLAIDISRASLAHTKYLAEKHGLRNLEVRLLDLNRVAALERDFDFVLSTGVLHHLEDPGCGLRALRDVLRPDGVMHLMLYGSTLRQGVYLLQQAFHLMGLGQTAQDVEIVRRALAILPARHSAHAYLNARNAAEELDDDAAIVDTFLHGRDRAYSPAQVFDLVEENGLAFLGWMDRLDFSVQAHCPGDDPLSTRIRALGEREQAAVIDLIAYSRGVHRFNVCHPAHFKTAPKIGFRGDAFLHYVPRLHWRLQITRPVEPDPARPVTLARDWHQVSLSRQEALLVDQCDGCRTIAQALGALEAESMADDDKVALARRLFALLHDTGHALFCVPPRPADDAPGERGDQPPGPGA
jgi:SAM-dependent methyltransferase